MLFSLLLLNMIEIRVVQVGAGRRVPLLLLSAVLIEGGDFVTGLT